MSALEACDLVAGYVPGVDILRGANVRVDDGELVGIIGPNGAGKSTLVKAVFGLVTIRSGTVLLRDDDVTGQKAHALVAKGVGYVPQLHNVFPTLTIEDNLRMGGFTKPSRFTARTAELLDLFPVLGEKRKDRAGSLSGGQRQLLAMARALMTEPTVLLLDEPSAGLSPMMQDEVFDRVREINATGVSILMVEQNARRCLTVCDRAYVLDQGVDALQGPGMELLEDPKVIELYLGSLGKPA